MKTKIYLSGPSGTGKSHLAREIAKMYDISFVDSPVAQVKPGEARQMNILIAFLEQRHLYHDDAAIFARAFIDTAAYNVFCSNADERADVEKYSEFCIAADSLLADFVVVMPFTGAKPKVYTLADEYKVHAFRLGLASQLKTQVHYATTYGDAKLAVCQFLEGEYVGQKA